MVDLGTQMLTGVFPKQPDANVSAGPLVLTWCTTCELLQLKHSYSLEEMYGDNYGYRSGLNASMIRHLQRKIRQLQRFAQPTLQDLVLDIGSNDATSLKAYQGDFTKVGMDPTGTKFREYYPDDVTLVSDFFNAKAFFEAFPGRKAKIITSIAMFYDLEDPNLFVSNIAEVLADDGIWHFEQSYMPFMLATNSYDTMCHEHLEFYSLKVVDNLLKRNGIKIIDVVTNAINGGSFAVTAAKAESHLPANTAVIDWMLRQEEAAGYGTGAPYEAFAERVRTHRDGLKDLISSLRRAGKKVVGYGASTKGNVLLQYCGFTRDDIACIADVNPDKDGAFTPGTGIPILSEDKVRAMKPDYYLVLPWHFRDHIIQREQEFMEAGGHLIFPLPTIEIV
jgi:hypothetical protein